MVGPGCEVVSVSLARFKQFFTVHFQLYDRIELVCSAAAMRMRGTSTRKSTMLIYMSTTATTMKQTQSLSAGTSSDDKHANDDVFNKMQEQKAYDLQSDVRKELRKFLGETINIVSLPVRALPKDKQMILQDLFDKASNIRPMKWACKPYGFILVVSSMRKLDERLKEMNAGGPLLVAGAPVYEFESYEGYQMQ